MDQVTVLVAQYLHFNVTGPFDEFLDIDFTRTEGALGFTRSAAHSFRQIRVSVYPPHTLPAAAGGSFQQHGIANGGCHGMGLPYRFEAALSSGNNWCSRRERDAARSRFRTHLFDRLNGRTDKLYARACTGLREGCILTQETIA